MDLFLDALSISLAVVIAMLIYRLIVDTFKMMMAERSLKTLDKLGKTIIYEIEDDDDFEETDGEA